MCNCGNSCGTCGNNGFFGVDSQTIIILIALWFFFCQGGNLCGNCGNNNCGGCGNNCGNCGFGGCGDCC